MSPVTRIELPKDIPDVVGFVVREEAAG